MENSNRRCLEKRSAIMEDILQLQFHRYVLLFLFFTLLIVLYIVRSSVPAIHHFQFGFKVESFPNRVQITDLVCSLMDPVTGKVTNGSGSDNQSEAPCNTGFEAEEGQLVICDGEPTAIMVNKKRPRSGESDDDKGTSSKYRKRSMVWDHVVELEGYDKKMAQCKYCKKKFPCDTKNGTGNMLTHLRSRCNKAPEHIRRYNQGQKTLCIDGIGSMTSTAFSSEAARIALAQMIIMDELPFRFVEGEGFRTFCSILQPKFKVPSRSTVSRDCLKTYTQVKNKIKASLAGQRVCLTTDTWTSIQNMNYMCLIAHYVDCHWTYNKKVLNFCIVESHKGEALGRALEGCILEWGLDSIFTVTVDNASANNLLISHLKKKTRGWKNVILDHEFIHMRCAAHILNLVVSDGLREFNESVEKIRNAVRYVRSSPSRLSAFKNAAVKQRIDSKSLLCLDVPTRWNSTYLMLEAAIKYQKAFECLEDEDLSYGMYFLEDDKLVDELDENVLLGRRSKGKRLGPPEPLDFENITTLVKFLKLFYDATLKFSGSACVTANICFVELAVIQNKINLYALSDEPLLSRVAKNMKCKFEKYWGQPSKTNMLLYVAVVLDPRRKLSYLKYCFERLMDNDSGKTLMESVEKALNSLFEWFVNNVMVNNAKLGGVPENSMDDVVFDNMDMDNFEVEFNKHIRAQCHESGSKTELEQYLIDNPLVSLVVESSFDILNWWKQNFQFGPQTLCILSI